MSAEFILVKLAIWIACGLWFLGSIGRGLSSQQPNDRWEFFYRWAWCLSGIFTWIHVTASYGIVHDWSHSSVLKQTGDESLAVVGFRVPWGVYANFVFASILLGYSLLMVVKRERALRWDGVIYFFLGFIVFNATVIFKFGTIRWVGLFAFAILIGLNLFVRPKKITASSVSGL